MAIVTRASVNRPLTFAEMDGNLLSAYAHYGQINISNNAAALALTAAVDQTLASNSDYVQVQGIFNAIPHGLNFGITQQANSLTVARNCVIRPHVWMSVTSNVANTNVAIKFAVNGVIGLERRPRAKIGSGGDRVNIAAHGFATFNAGDVVTLWIASDKTASITIDDAVFSLDELRTL